MPVPDHPRPPRRPPRRPAPGRRRVAVLVALLAVVSAGCSLPSRTERVVDFVRVDGKQYVRVDGGDVIRAPDPATFGPEVGYVARTVGDPGDEPLRNGDAAYLRPGTVLHAVPGFEPWFRLGAALPEGRSALYELADRPDARTGADLLDLAAGATSVAVESSTGSVIGVSQDPAVVDGLVAGLLALPVADTPLTTERPDYVLEVRFPEPLPPVRRAVFVADRSLGGQLRLDDATLCAIERVAGRPCTAGG